MASSPRTILLVDDSRVVHELARLALEPHGWRVVGVDSGAEAVPVAVAQKPDAVLLDVEMPGLDGPATLAALRADPATMRLPVIFMTGSIDAASYERLALLGAIEIFAKPFELVSLAGRIERTLGWTP
ncbi:MAG: response regulator receiver protein [Conexibacter sp.]|nr:response regulator receiver protein [Conexibacter sp.]